MSDLGWLAPTVLSAGTLTVSMALYRLQRREHRDVKWTATVEETGKGQRDLLLTNRGVGKARHTTVEVDPVPLRLTDSVDAGDVDLGAVVKVGWVVAWGAPEPDRVTVRWRGRLGRRHTWTSQL
jgi:hypothetical protein